MKVRLVAVVLLVACVIPTVALSRWMALTPDAVLREADFGAVLSTQLRPSWVPDDGVTTVTTTAGVFALKGLVSMPRGQHLVVVDSVQHEVRACADRTLSSCMRFAGPYIGAPLPVPHAPTRLDHAT